MPIISIDHVQIAMPEGQEDTARAFYINILGFTEIPKPSALIKRGGAWFQSESVRLHLGVEKDFHPARKAHPAFIVYDLEVMLEMVQQAGYEWDESQPALDGYKRAHIYDPFGNRIELLEPI
jgi:catechol 2,3-dioxygenase-like lactoylglutathione lyase family enzyme